MLAETLRLPKDVHLEQAGLANLPVGWKVVEIGELLCDDRGISVGVMYPGDHDPLGNPLIKVGDMTGNLINPRPPFRISPAKHEEYRRTKLEGGELLLTLVGGLGQCAVVKKSMAGWNAARAIAVIRLKEPSDAHFLRICLLSEPLQYLMNSWANTTVQATLNLKEIRLLPVPWPPKSERDAIAKAIGALDDKIELNRQMSETLESIAQVLFTSWFVDETASGLPKGWRLGNLRDCCERVENGGTPKRNEPSYWLPAEIPWLTSGEVRQAIVMKTNNFISQEGLTSSNAKLWAQATTVVALYGATSGQVTFLGHEMSANQACCGLVPKSDMRYYIYLHTSSSARALERQARGSAQQNLSQQIVADFPVIIPDGDTLRRFDSILHPLFKRWMANIEESSTLGELRDALLPKLLSGETRINLKWPLEDLP